MRILENGAVTGNFEDYPVSPFQKDKINEIGEAILMHVKELPQLRLRLLTGDLHLETHFPIK